MTDNLEVIVHYLETHKKKYYNKTEVNKEDLWFSLFVSNCLVEQNKILKELVSDDIRNNFIRSVINMSSESKLIIDFNAESYNNYVHEEKLREAKEEGIEQGIEQNKKETVLKLLNMNMSYGDIGGVVELSVEKIKEIEKNK